MTYMHKEKGKQQSWIVIMINALNYLKRLFPTFLNLRPFTKTSHTSTILHPDISHSIHKFSNYISLNFGCKEKRWGNWVGVYEPYIAFNYFTCLTPTWRTWRSTDRPWYSRYVPIAHLLQVSTTDSAHIAFAYFHYVCLLVLFKQHSHSSLTLPTWRLYSLHTWRSLTSFSFFLFSSASEPDPRSACLRDAHSAYLCAPSYIIFPAFITSVTYLTYLHSYLIYLGPTLLPYHLCTLPTCYSHILLIWWLHSLLCVCYLTYLAFTYQTLLIVHLLYLRGT